MSCLSFFYLQLKKQIQAEEKIINDIKEKVKTLKNLQRDMERKVNLFTQMMCLQLK